jgi:hypothetical protein
VKRTIILLIIYLFIAVCSFASDTTRILFIGNSFTYTYDVPSLVKGLASAAGHHVEYAQHVPGGISVGDTAQGNLAHMNNPAVFDLIRQGSWDFVVLQDNQGRFVYNYGLFPSSSKVIEGHKKILDSVMHYSPCAHMLWFAGWAFKNGYPPYGNTGAEMIDRIYVNYSFLKDSLGGINAPIGIAWERAVAEIPAIDLWGPDAAHQSLAGSYVTAAVLFETVFRKDVTNTDFDGGLDSATARTYRRIAYETVVDSAERTGLAEFMPVIDAAGNILTTMAGYTSYDWYRNGELAVSGTSNMLIVSGSGCYQVVVNNASGCRQRSLEYCLTLTSVGGNTNPGEHVKIYPNPVNDRLYIETTGAVILELSVYDAAGRRLYQKQLDSETVNIPVRDLPEGLYFGNIRTMRETQAFKFVVVH